MKPPPSRADRAGQVYLDLQRLARSTGRPTQELLQLYALEAFLVRLTQSEHRDRLILKGGVLLAAFRSRRATRDIDFAARAIANDLVVVQSTVESILAVSLDDGVSFDPTSISATTIRDDDEYSGVRVSFVAQIARATLHVHVDVNVGDPIWPGPQTVSLPRLLDDVPLKIVGYPIAMVLAEKIVTAMQRGTANTRWRDFVDIASLIDANTPDPYEVRAAIHKVAAHRQVAVTKLGEVLRGFGPIGQARWQAWRRTQALEDSTPQDFDQLLATVIDYVDALLTS